MTDSGIVTVKADNSDTLIDVCELCGYFADKNDICGWCGELRCPVCGGNCGCAEAQEAMKGMYP